MTPRYACLGIMPVGPRSIAGRVADSVEAYLHYFSTDCALLVLDDSRGALPSSATPTSARVMRIDSRGLTEEGGRGHNTGGTLFVKQMLALDYAATQCTWECLLRLDDDALVIGPNVHSLALQRFAEQRTLGMLGAYTERGDGSSKLVAMREQRDRILRHLWSRRVLANPRMGYDLLRVCLQARDAGYRLGDMCTGGAFFVAGAASRDMLALFRQFGRRLDRCALHDDLLIALFVGAAGYHLGDFSRADEPLAINWLGLPMSPEELVRRCKYIVHPIRDHEDPALEDQVRAFFRDRRMADAHDW